jgi:hypothetical protein
MKVPLTSKQFCIEVNLEGYDVEVMRYGCAMYDDSVLAGSYDPHHSGNLIDGWLPWA